MANDIAIPEFFSLTKTYHHAPYDAISPLLPHLQAGVAGKTVIVTGGGTGIGRSIAKAFAQAGAASVAILGRREDRLKTSIQEITTSLTTQKTKLLYEVADLIDREGTKKAIENVVKRQERDKIDIFVSNAGAAASLGPILSHTDDEFMRGFDLNVRTAFNAIKAFLPYAAEEPKLFSISTGIVHMDPIPGVGVYAASKTANAKLLEYVAAEHPELYVVQVQPGVVSTEINEGTSMRGQDDGKWLHQRILLCVCLLTLTLIVALPGHFAVWLASDDAKFLRNKFVWVNWDVEELKAKAEEIKSSRLLSIGLDGVPM